MAELNQDKIKKLRRGERLGSAALWVCAAVLVYFIVCFTVAQTLGLSVLRLSTAIAAPILMAAAVCVAAYCNLKYGGELDRLIKAYIVDVFVENAAAMHPERNSLTFYMSLTDAKLEIKVNNYTEKIVFDFTAFGKLSPLRKLSVMSAVETRLCNTFCRLAERGAQYSSVSYTERSGKKKTKKPVCVIENGVPDPHAMRNYLKSK